MAKYSFSEADMRSAFIAGYQKVGRELCVEVPVFCRSVDLVAYDKKKQEITAIEFKLGNWKRAVLQAMQVACCFDFLAICIPHPATTRGRNSVLSGCNEYGIGVFFYNSEQHTFEEALMPQHISEIWEVQKKRVLEYLGGIDNE
ncbi:MAG: hypothetical protein HDT33_02580 [Clostridiales bacterium]|nr:hypothetical protein [Clostridiales bacterium]